MSTSIRHCSTYQHERQCSQGKILFGDVLGSDLHCFCDGIIPVCFCCCIIGSSWEQHGVTPIRSRQCGDGTHGHNRPFNGKLGALINDIALQGTGIGTLTIAKLKCADPGCPGANALGQHVFRG